MTTILFTIGIILSIAWGIMAIAFILVILDMKFSIFWTIERKFKIGYYKDLDKIQSRWFNKKD